MWPSDEELNAKMFIRLKNTTFVPTIIISLIAVVWCYYVLEERIELLRAIVLIVFMNIISTINYYEDIIPDKINLLLGATGLVSNLTTGMVSIPSMIGGILIGGGSLYLVAVIYEIMTKREGLGGGVIKYCAALGLWLGIGGIALTILYAFFLGILFGLIIVPLCRIIRPKASIQSVPADGFFSAGAFLTLLYGSQMISHF